MKTLSSCTSNFCPCVSFLFSSWPRAGRQLRPVSGWETGWCPSVKPMQKKWPMWRHKTRSEQQQTRSPSPSASKSCNTTKHYMIAHPALYLKHSSINLLLHSSLDKTPRCPWNLPPFDRWLKQIGIKVISFPKRLSFRFRLGLEFHFIHKSQPY